MGDDGMVDEGACDEEEEVAVVVGQSRTTREPLL